MAIDVPATPGGFPSRLFNSLAVSVVVAAADGARVIHWNGHAEQLYGHSRREAMGRAFPDLISPTPDGERVRTVIDRVLRGESWDGRLDVRRKTGEVVAVHAQLSPTWSDAARCSGLVGMAVPVVREEIDAALARYVLHDPLTGLANRVLLLDRLEHALSRTNRTDQATAVLFIDLDGFKRVNDSRGHAAGDELLRTVAGRLEAAVRPSDTVARLGGDEFVVVCEEVHPGTEVDLASRVHVAASSGAGAGDPAVTASIGIALAIGGHVPASRVLADADAAMYRAKEAGGGRWEISVRLGPSAHHHS